MIYKHISYPETLYEVVTRIYGIIWYSKSYWSDFCSTQLIIRELYRYPLFDAFWYVVNSCQIVLRMMNFIHCRNVSGHGVPLRKRSTETGRRLLYTVYVYKMLLFCRLCTPHTRDYFVINVLEKKNRIDTAFRVRFLFLFIASSIHDCPTTTPLPLIQIACRQCLVRHLWFR